MDKQKRQIEMLQAELTEAKSINKQLKGYSTVK